MQTGLERLEPLGQILAGYFIDEGRFRDLVITPCRVLCVAGVNVSLELGKLAQLGGANLRTVFLS